MTDLLPVVTAFIVDAPLPAVASAALSFVLAVLLGAFRQLCSSMMRRTVPMEVADEAGNRSVARLGTNPPPIWFSPAFRLGSWALVTALSLWPALVAATLFAFRGIVSVPVLVALASVLLARWIASAALVRSHELADAWQALRGSGGRFLRGHTAFVQKLRFSPGGCWLATASHDDTVRVWDVAARREVQRFAIARDVRPGPGWPVEIGAIAFSGDGALLASVEPADKRVRLYDTRGGRELRVLADHPHPVTAVAVSLDGRLVATAYGETTGAGSREVDAGIRLFEASTGRMIREMRVASGVTTLAFSHDGRWLISGSLGEAPVTLWDVTTGVAERTLGLPEAAEYGRQRLESARARLAESMPDHLETLMGPKVWALAFSPDGQAMAAGSDFTMVWSVATGRRVATLDHRWTPGHGGFATDLAFSADGRRLATALYSETEVTVWDLATGRALSTLQGYRRAFELPDTPVAVGFTREGRLLFAHTDRSTVRLWNVAVGASGRSRR